MPQSESTTAVKHSIARQMDRMRPVLKGNLATARGAFRSREPALLPAILMRSGARARSVPKRGSGRTQIASANSHLSEARGFAKP